MSGPDIRHNLFPLLQDNEIEIDDPQLKRILRLTSEDTTFMSYLIRAIAENSDPFSSVDIFDESQHVFYEGSDEWIRCHFKNYLLHLMRCSSLDGKWPGRIRKRKCSI